MMKAVASALNAEYSGKKWLKWFETTAEAVIAELDGKSMTDAVSSLYCVSGRFDDVLFGAFVLLCVLFPLFERNETMICPTEATPQIASD